MDQSKCVRLDDIYYRKTRDKISVFMYELSSYSENDLKN